MSEYVDRTRQAAEEIGAIVDQSKQQAATLVDRSREPVNEPVDRRREAPDLARARWEEFVQQSKRPSRGTVDADRQAGYLADNLTPRGISA
jgi:hypothetical protein